MYIQVAVTADQCEYLDAKAASLGKTVSELVKNLLLFGRLTPDLYKAQNSKGISFSQKRRLTPRGHES